MEKQKLSPLSWFIMASIVLVAGCSCFCAGPIIPPCGSFDPSNIDVPPSAAIENPETAPGGGRILFSTTRSGGNHVYVMNADGSAIQRLTVSSEGDGEPRWSPDGTRIVYSHKDDDCHGAVITVMNADGSGATPLSPGTYMAYYPKWSPDSKRLSFHGYPHQIGEVFVADLEEGTVSQITKSPFDPVTWSDQANWSPDGSKIVLIKRENHEPFEMFIVDPDGSNLHALGTKSLNPVWSPDGKQIAFRGTENLGLDIWLVHPDGSDLRRLTKLGGVFGGDPIEWSPDGTKILFASVIRDGRAKSDIYVIDADGQNLTNLTNNPADEGYPTWSPDGSRIAFVSERDGNPEIYVMNADGTNVIRLTNDPAYQLWPSWQPVPNGEASANQ